MAKIGLRKNPISPRGCRGKVIRSVEELERKAQPDAEGYEEFMRLLREMRNGDKVRR